jgi:hypothetical protein
VPLRRNRSGIAEKTSVPISRGGTSRYIIAWFFLSYPVRRTIDDLIRVVDCEAEAATSRSVLGRCRHGLLLSARKINVQALSFGLRLERL